MINYLRYHILRRKDRLRKSPQPPLQGGVRGLFSLQGGGKPFPRGFTLLEIVVALTIAAVALPILLRSFSEGTKKQSLIENRTTALYLLKLRMSEIEMLGELEEGSEEGEFGTDSRFTWSSDIAESDIENLYEVTVTVNWQERGQQKSVQLTTYMADRNIEQEEELG